MTPEIFGLKNAKLTRKNYLTISYEEKDRAKQCGAKWDPDECRWYTFESTSEFLKKFTRVPIKPWNSDELFGILLKSKLHPTEVNALMESHNKSLAVINAQIDKHNAKLKREEEISLILEMHKDIKRIKQKLDDNIKLFI